MPPTTNKVGTEPFESWVDIKRIFISECCRESDCDNVTTVAFWREEKPVAELEKIPRGWVWGWVSDDTDVSLTATFGSVSEALLELERVINNG